MTSPFEAAGFKTAPFTVYTPSTPAPNGTSNPVNPGQTSDTFVKEDREALKTEVKEELKKEMEAEEKKEKKKEKKKGLFSGLNRLIGGLKKVGIGAQEYTIGFGKGLVNGGIIGAVGFGGLKLAQKLGAFAKVGAKETSGRIAGALLNTAGKVLRSNKLAIGIGVIGVGIGMLYQLWKASLNVNERSAEIDHRYIGTAHND